MVDYEYITDTGILLEKVGCLGIEEADEYNKCYFADLKNELEKCNVKHTVMLNPQELDRYYELHGLTELILKVTDGCNFRCKYCVYSEHYPHSVGYGKEKMDEDTAYKAIDYYLRGIRKQKKYIFDKKPYIAFYGGEPLLNFDVIRRSIEYTQKNYSDLDVEFTITTNGYALDNTYISDFLKEHNVIICISLDGYSKNHDRNRKTQDNSDTYVKLMAIIKKHFINYPRIYSLCCIDYKTDLLELYRYYMENDRMNGGMIPHLLRISLINDVGTDYYKQFSSAEKYTFINQFQTLENKYIELACKGNHNWFLDLLIGQELIRIFDRPKFITSNGYYCMNGCCLPGDKVYVLPDGRFGICEKVTVKEFDIGNVNTGINFDKVIALINNVNTLMYEKCSKCELFTACSICYSHCISWDKLGISTDTCEHRKYNFRHKIEVIQKILQNCPEFFNDTIKKSATATLQFNLMDKNLEHEG